MTLTPYQADYNRYWEGKTTLEMVDDVLRELGVAPRDYDRYPKADVVRALNEAGAMFAWKTNCLTYPVAIRLKATRQDYRVPYGSLRVISGRYYHSESATEYDELKILRSPKHMQRIDCQYRGTAGIPEYLFPTYTSGNVGMFGISPIVSADGERFNTDNYGLLVASTGLEFTGNITGTHHASYNGTAYLVDTAGRDMTALNAYANMPVYNTTTGAWAMITGFASQEANNDRVNGTLSAGTWGAGDAFLIPVSEFGVLFDAVNYSVYTVSSFIGTVGEVLGYAGNILLDMARKPLLLSSDIDDLVSEIPEIYQDAQASYAVYLLGKQNFKGMMQMDKALAALSFFNSRVNEFLNTDSSFEQTENAIEYIDW